MSSRSVMIIMLAVIAAAVACLIMLPMDSDAADTEPSLTAYASQTADVFQAGMLDPRVEPRAPLCPPDVPSDEEVPEDITGDLPRIPKGQDPTMSKEPKLIPKPPVEAPSMVEPNHFEITVPSYVDPVSAERIIDDYEFIFKEKRELESGGNRVDVIDANEYEGVQADLVSIMSELVANDPASIPNDGFVEMLLLKLKENGMSDAADAVRAVMQYRSLDQEVLAEVQQPGFKSKDSAEEDDDDINSVPYRMEEVTEDEDAPKMYVSDISFEEIILTPAADDITFRSVDRGCRLLF